MNKPHVVIDQVYKKISYTRSVAFNASKTCLDKDKMRYDEADSVEDAILLAAKMIKKFNL